MTIIVRGHWERILAGLHEAPGPSGGLNMMNWQDLAMVGLLLAAEALSNVGSFSVETEEQVVRVSQDTGSDGSTVVPPTRPTG